MSLSKKLDILYDHYKDTSEICIKTNTNRNKIFLYLCVSVLFSLVFLIYPKEVIDFLNQIINNKYSITISITYIIIQMCSWLIILYFLIRYIQLNIYLERQYIYLDTLEKAINKILQSKNYKFNREGEGYLDKYPKILNIIDFFYKRFFPIFIFLATTIKLYYECYDKINYILIVIDAIIYFFIFVLLYYYFIELHLAKNTK